MNENDENRADTISPSQETENRTGDQVSRDVTAENSNKKEGGITISDLNHENLLFSKDNEEKSNLSVEPNNRINSEIQECHDVGGGKIGEVNTAFEDFPAGGSDIQRSEDAPEVVQGQVNYGLDDEEIGGADVKGQPDSEKIGESEGNEIKKRKDSNTGSTAYTQVGKLTGGSRFSTWLTWLKKEMTINKKLLSIKVIQFLYSGGTNSMLPYLTLHMQELGLTVKQIGVIYAFLPIATILGPPLSGMLADRTGNYKMVVLLNMIVTTILHVAFLYLPGEGPNKLSFECGGSADPALLWARCRDCHDNYQDMNFSLTIKNCRFIGANPSTTAFDLCLDAANASSGEFCRSFDIGLNDELQFVLNGTMSASAVAGDTCSNSWQEIRHEDQVYSGLRCSSSLPVECDALGAPSCHADPEAFSNTTFWIYLPMRLIATFFLASLFTMMDAMTMAIVKQHGGEYGKQRFLFILGMATVPLLAGFLNDWDAGSNGTSSYLPSMYLGAVLCIASAVLIARLDFKVDIAEDNVLQDLKKLVSKPEINVYFLMILILGSNWGFIESYLFLYMKDLGSPNYLMGLTMTVGSLIGMPVMLVADKIVDKIGRHNVFIISFFAYALRHFGYSIISSPWMVFPFELLEVFTYQLMWVAAVTFCPILAPPGLLATMTGVAGAVHFSVGRGVGSLVGGQLISHMEISGAFQCYGGIALASGILYIILHFCYFKKKIAAREEELKHAGVRQQDEELAEIDQMVKKKHENVEN